MSSPFELATQIIDAYDISRVMGIGGIAKLAHRDAAISSIQSAIVNATNAELEKRRAAEQELDMWKRIALSLGYGKAPFTS